MHLINASRALPAQRQLSLPTLSKIATPLARSSFLHLPPDPHTSASANLHTALGGWPGAAGLCPLAPSREQAGYQRWEGECGHGVNSWAGSLSAGLLCAVWPLKDPRPSSWPTLTLASLHVLVTAPSPPCHSPRYYTIPWIPLYLVHFFGGNAFIKPFSITQNTLSLLFQGPNSPPATMYLSSELSVSHLEY